MNTEIYQILSVVVIVAIGIFIFAKYTFKPKTIDLVLASLLIVLSVVLSSASIKLALFGAMSLKIGFSQLPLMIIGTVLGPCWAYISGIVQDILDVIINPSGFPFFGFTLNKVLIACLPALWCYSNKKVSEKSYKAIFVLLSLVYLIATGSIFFLDKITKTESLMPNYKIILFTVTTIVMILMVIIILIFKKKYTNENTKYPMVNWLISISLVEYIVQLVLTPTWLDVMYGIPYGLNLLVRLVKAPLNILLSGIIGYFVLQTIDKIKRK